MYGQALKAWLGSGRVGVQWAGVLQRLFSMPIGCSGHLIRLEGTVHSDFETWTSLKNQQGSCGGRKGWSGSEGGCANSSAWVGSRMCKLLVPAPGHAFFFFSLYLSAEIVRFSHRTVRLSQRVGKKLLFACDSHTMIHPVPYYRQQPWQLSCAILPLSRTSREHNPLCWAISEWSDSSHRQNRKPGQKDLLKFPLLQQFNISCAINTFSFGVQVVKASP